MGHSLIGNLTLSSSSLQASPPEIPRSLRSTAPKPGSRGPAPWPKLCAPTSPSAEGWRELGVQFWSRGLPVHRFFTPLVIEGEQEACSYLLKSPLQRPDLGRSETPRIETLQLLEHVDPSPFGVSSEPGGDLIPQAHVRICARAPVTRPSTFLILAFSCLFQQRGRSARNTIHRTLLNTLSSIVGVDQEDGKRKQRLRSLKSSDDG
jgi:hypothetical protein